MKITIYQPAGFNEKGNRSNNEDTIYPLPDTATAMDTLFLVCDGVGGEHKGEVASALACQSISHYFSGLHAAHITEDNVQQALDVSQKAFEITEQNDPETHGMATTMTLLFLGNSGVVIAHLGDSRIYQVRNGKIIFQTKDHKWVNELVESGVITEEQAREHPKRNVITRVISADRHDQPDFKIIQDVQPEDYFFMCTDGVLEQLYDELLEYHLRDNPDNHYSMEEIIATIKEECEGKTNDNFSAYLIKIKSVDAGSTVISMQTGTHQHKPSAAPIISDQANKSKGVFYTIFMFVGLLLIGGTAFYFMQKPKNKKTDIKTIPDSSGTSYKASPTDILNEIKPVKLVTDNEGSEEKQVDKIAKKEKKDLIGVTRQHGAEINTVLKQDSTKSDTIKHFLQLNEREAIPADSEKPFIKSRIPVFQKNNLK